jgi:undecaprenyl-diphosphatase
VTPAAVANNLLRVFESGDRRVMLRVSRWPAPRWVRVWMLCATRGGDGWLWYTLGALILAFGGDARFEAVGSAALAVGAGITLFLWLKKRIGRKRPCAIEPVCWHTLLPPDQFSFPSGHTITGFSVATALAHFYPGLAPGLWICAASVAISRVLLGMHFVSDVLAGAVLGGVLARASVWLVGALVNGA